MNRKARNRSKSGKVIAEFAAVLVFGGPLLILLVFLGLECCKFYTIKSAMEVGARKAARTLVVLYNTTGTENTVVTVGSTKTGTTILPKENFIANSNQFNVAWDSSSPPTYVTVTCSYPSGGADGLDPFPNGPLRYLSNNSTFSLNNIVVQGTFTLPVQ